MKKMTKTFWLIADFVRLAPPSLMIYHQARTIISLLCLAGAALAQEQPPEIILQNGHFSSVNTVAVVTS